MPPHQAGSAIHGWYLFDEGGRSGSGGWGHARTTWDPSVAMPHGWAIAELYLLMRDALVFEDGDRLVLLGGITGEGLRGMWRHQMELQTHFGRLEMSMAQRTARDSSPDEFILGLGGTAKPPGGFVLRLPPGWTAALPNGKPLARRHEDVLLPADAKTVYLTGVK